MSAYRNFVLTNSGISLINDVLKGDGELEFRYISIGSGIYEDDDKKTDAIRNMSCLKEERQKVGFSNVIKHDKTVELKAHITNQGVTEEYLMTELGIYASTKGSETEILYCVSVREGAPDVMPDFSIGRIHDVIFKVQVSIGDVSNVSIDYKTDVYALAEDLANHVTDKDNPHHVTKDQVGLSNVDNTADADKPISAIQQAAIDAVKNLLEAAIDAHIADKNDPHNATKEQVGLGNADNTADIDKPVSTAQQAAMDDLHQQLTAYTQAKIAELINGAPTSMDTLKEVSDAIAAHKSVMDALDAAIGKKANAAEFDSHTKDTTKHIMTAERNAWNAKMETTGDSANNTVTFSSGDAASPTGWADIGVVASGEKHSSLFRKMSLAVKNLRYLWKLLGATNLSGIGDGTVTGAIKSLNTGLADFGNTAVKKIRISGYCETFADFWRIIESADNDGAGCFVRFKQGAWGIEPGHWSRAWCSYQNRVGNGVYSTNGSILLTNDGNELYIGQVVGGKDGYEGLSVSWMKILDKKYTSYASTVIGSTGVDLHDLTEPYDAYLEIHIVIKVVVGANDITFVKDVLLSDLNLSNNANAGRDVILTVDGGYLSNAYNSYCVIKIRNFILSLSTLNIDGADRLNSAKMWISYR